MAQAGVPEQTGRKRSAQTAVLDAECRLCHKDLVSVVAQGRAGLGLVPHHKDTKGKERRRQIQDEVRAVVDKERSIRAAGLSQQGPWTRWEKAMDRKVTLMDLW